MKLVDGQITSFDLDIVGYQFTDEDQGVNSPSLTFSDCNWLMVKGMTMMPNLKSWEFMDPCLNTAELENLADWFDKISGSPIPRVISFMEPNIKMSFASLSIGSARVQLRSRIGSVFVGHTGPRRA